MSATEWSPVPAKVYSCLLEDDADLRDLVTEFVAALPARIDELQQALAALDWQQLALLAHRLKGASGSYGYPDVTVTAGLMEEAANAGHAAPCADGIERLRRYAAAAAAGLD